MENRIAELESRIEKLENMLKSIELSGDGQNISFNQTPLYAVKISGDGADTNFINSAVGYAVTADNDELEDLEDTANELECRIEDIKCAALDAKAILDEVQAHFNKLSPENAKAILPYWYTPIIAKAEKILINEIL